MGRCQTRTQLWIWNTNKRAHNVRRPEHRGAPRLASGWFLTTESTARRSNFQRAAGHGVNTIHIGLRILQEYAAAPGCLHFQCGCVVCGNRWRRQCCGTYNGRAAQEFSTIQSVSHVSSQGFLESDDTQCAARLYFRLLAPNLASKDHRSSYPSPHSTSSSNNS